MYRLKERLQLEIFEYRFAELVGIEPETLSAIQNRRKSCTAVVAKGICYVYSELKNSKYNVDDIFEKE